MNDTEKALQALEQNQKKRARFYLRRELGEETMYMEMNGHIFPKDPSVRDNATNKRCRSSGCEMAHPAHSETERCPASLEGHNWANGRKMTQRKRDRWEEEHDWGK